MQKRWVKAAIAAAVLAVAVLVLVPFFVNADTFRPEIQVELSSALGRKVTLGHISLSLVTGSLVADTFRLRTILSFPPALFWRRRSFASASRSGRCIFHRSIQITNFTVNSPSMQLIHAANGTWNFSSLGSSAAQTATQQTGAPPSLTVDELKIENGSVALSSLPAAGKPFACTDVNLTVQAVIVYPIVSLRTFAQGCGRRFAEPERHGGADCAKRYLAYALRCDAGDQALRSAGGRGNRSQRRHFDACRLHRPNRVKGRQSDHHGKAAAIPA